MAVGILALQGAFAEHAAVLDKLGVPHFEIRQKRDLDQPMNGLIIPGGESTVMNKLLRELDLYDTLREQIQNAKCTGVYHLHYFYISRVKKALLTGEEYLARTDVLLIDAVALFHRKTYGLFTEHMFTGVKSI